MHLIRLRQHRLAALIAAVVLALATVTLVVAMSPARAKATDPTTPALAPAANAHAGHSATEAQRVDAPAAAQGVNPKTLGTAGWTCLFVVHAVHCAPPGGLEGLTSGTAKTLEVLVFDTKDPAAANAPFLGSELNVRADLFHGQPCPTDPPSRKYTYLPDLGLPFKYYACHRFDSPL